MGGGKKAQFPRDIMQRLVSLGMCILKSFPLKKLGLHLVMGDVGWRRMEVNPMRKLDSILPGKLGKYLY